MSAQTIALTNTGHRYWVEDVAFLIMPRGVPARVWVAVPRAQSTRDAAAPTVARGDGRGAEMTAL